MCKALNLLSLLAPVDAGSFARSGGIALLLDVLKSPAARRPPPPSTATHLLANLLYAGANLLDRTTRSRAGLDALLSTDGGVSAVLSLAICDVTQQQQQQQSARDSENGGDSSPGSKNTKKLQKLGSMRRFTVVSPGSPREPASTSSGAVSPGGFGNGNGGGGGGGGTQSARGGSGGGHLEATLRVLDRLARGEGGIAALRAAGADAALVALWSLSAPHRRTEALAMRLLVRLMGGDARELLARAESGTRPLPERVLAARLLAAVAAADAVARANLIGNSGNASGSPLLERPLALLADGSDLATSDAAEPLLATLASLARASPEAVSLLEEAGALHVATHTLATRAGDAGTAGAAISLLAAMVDCSHLALLVSNPLPGPKVTNTSAAAIIRAPLSLVAEALTLQTDAMELALPTARLLGAVLRYGSPPGTAANAIFSAGALSPLLLAMSTHAASNALSLQLAGSEVLNGLIDSGAHASAAYANGALNRALANLTSIGAGGFSVGGINQGASALAASVTSIFSPGADPATQTAGTMGGGGGGRCRRCSYSYCPRLSYNIPRCIFTCSYYFSVYCIPCNCCRGKIKGSCKSNGCCLCPCRHRLLRSHSLS